MKYFFNIYDDAETLDFEGTELPDLPAAVAYATRGARSLIGETVSTGYLNRQHRVEVVGSDDILLHTVWFDEAVEIR